jgi:hypothetical protein
VIRRRDDPLVGIIAFDLTCDGCGRHRLFTDLPQPGQRAPGWDKVLGDWAVSQLDGRRHYCHACRVFEDLAIALFF